MLDSGVSTSLRHNQGLRLARTSLSTEGICTTCLPEVQGVSLGSYPVKPDRFSSWALSDYEQSDRPARKRSRRKGQPAWELRPRTVMNLTCWASAIPSCIAVLYTLYWLKSRFLSGSDCTTSPVHIFIALGLGGICYWSLWLQVPMPQRVLVTRSIPLEGGTVLQGTFVPVLNGRHTIGVTTTNSNNEHHARLDIEWKVTRNGQAVATGVDDEHDEIDFSRQPHLSKLQDFEAVYGRAYSYRVRVRKTTPEWEDVTPMLEIGRGQGGADSYGYEVLGWEMVGLAKRAAALAIACMLYCWALSHLVALEQQNTTNHVQGDRGGQAGNPTDGS